MKRTHNISYSGEDNPFFSELTFNNSLSKLASALTPEVLTILRTAAKLAYPQKVCKLGVIDILLDGAGTYIPSQNAHGDPTYSWPIFLNEIVKAKKNSNNLVGSRPNIVMVNGLGIDFQFSFNHNHTDAELPCSIDELWITTCGVVDPLSDNPPIRKIFRNGY